MQKSTLSTIIALVIILAISTISFAGTIEDQISSLQQETTGLAAKIQIYTQNMEDAKNLQKNEKFHENLEILGGILNEPYSIDGEVIVYNGNFKVEIQPSELKNKSKSIAQRFHRDMILEMARNGIKSRIKILEHEREQLSEDFCSKKQQLVALQEQKKVRDFKTAALATADGSTIIEVCNLEQIISYSDHKQKCGGLCLKMDDDEESISWGIYIYKGGDIIGKWINNGTNPEINQNQTSEETFRVLIYSFMVENQDVIKIISKKPQNPPSNAGQKQWYQEFRQIQSRT